MYAVIVAMVIGVPPEMPAPAVEQPWLMVICSKPKVKPIEQVIAEHPVIQMPDLKTHQWPRVIGGELVPAFQPSVMYQPSYMPSAQPYCVGGNCYGGR